MSLLRDTIWAALEAKLVRDELDDSLSVHIPRMIFASFFDMGPDGERVTFNAGVRLGRALVEMGEVKGESLEEMLRGLIEVLNTLNLGIVTLEEADDNAAVVQVRDCYFCKGLPVMGDGVCFYEAGLFSGAVGRAFGVDAGVVETKCYCMGDEMCEYEIEL